MKRGTTEHPKTYTLAAQLGIQRWGAVGILESLWHYAQKYAPAGDVGRYPDEAIARAIGWGENASQLVSALVSAGWLDECKCHRLRVHDWPDHCDQTVERTVNSRFPKCYAKTSMKLANARMKLAAVPCRAVPSLAKPKPNGLSSDAAAPEVASDPVREVFDHWRNVMPARKAAKLTDNRRTKIKARLADGYTSAQLLEAVDGCRASPFHMGDNDRRTIYDELTLICRNGEKVEFFRGIRPREQRAEPSKDWLAGAPEWIDARGGPNAVVRTFLDWSEGKMEQGETDQAAFKRWAGDCPRGAYSLVSARLYYARRDAARAK